MWFSYKYIIVTCGTSSLSRCGSVTKEQAIICIVKYIPPRISINLGTRSSNSGSEIENLDSSLIPSKIYEGVKGKTSYS